MSRANLATNPSFENGVSQWSSAGFFTSPWNAGDWTATTALRSDAGWSRSGSKSGYLKLTKAATTNSSAWLVNTPTGTSGSPVSPGQIIRFDIYANILDAAGVGTNALVLFYNSGGSAITGATSGQTASTRVITATGQQHFILTAEAPAGSVYAAGVLGIFSSTSGDVFEAYLDSVLLERLEEDPLLHAPRGEVQADFTTKADGAHLVADTGQPFDVSQFVGNWDFTDTTAKFRVKNGKLMDLRTGSGNTRTYAQVNLGRPVKLAGCEFVFEQQAGDGDNGFATMVAGSYVNLAGTSVGTPYSTDWNLNIHLKTGPANWLLEVVTGGAITTWMTGTYASRLLTDGATTYRMEVVRIGSTLLFRLPDGTRKSATDPLVASLEGNNILWENGQTDSSVDVKPEFTKIWADGDERLKENAYADGDTTGWYWSGAPHASTSLERAVQRASINVGSSAGLALG